MMLYQGKAAVMGFADVAFYASGIELVAPSLVLRLHAVVGISDAILHYASLLFADFNVPSHFCMVDVQLTSSFHQTSPT
jgi:hypothetical protein